MRSRRPLTSRQKPPHARSGGLDRQWHLAGDELEIGFTELEFAIFRVAAAFERWQADCLSCCVDQPFSGAEAAMLHVIRMHERPKSVSEIARLLNRDDLANIQYGVRKLLKGGLIQKSDNAGSKRDVTYVVSAMGRDVTDRYARFRRELLISMARHSAADTSFDEISRALNLMSALYGQASCIAATHRIAS
jgi:predicted MarR family transcription regulator